MKKNILFLMCLLLFSGAYAEEWCNEDSCYLNETPFYAKILSGANFLQNTTLDGNKSTYQTGYLVAPSIGYNWRYGLSLEAEYAYRRNAISKIHFFGGDSSSHGHFQTSSYMANLLWNLPSCFFENVQSYIGAGIGYDHQQMHASNDRIVFNQKWNHFAWQLMAGLTHSLFCNTELSVEYKFHQGGCHFYNHTLGIGLAYKFGL